MARKGTNDSKDALSEVMQAGRDKMRLTRDDLAELLELSPRYLLSLENENKKPSFHTLYAIIRALGVDANTIFYPESSEPDTTAGRVARLLPQCDEHEIEAVAALVEKLLSEKKKRK